MGGGRENPILMSTRAIVELGTTIAAERTIIESNFFIVAASAFVFHPVTVVFLVAVSTVDRVAVGSMMTLFGRKSDFIVKGR